MADDWYVLERIGGGLWWGTDPTGTFNGWFSDPQQATAFDEPVESDPDDLPEGVAAGGVWKKWSQVRQAHYG